MLRFVYRLAKELGIWDVRGMLRRMTGSQLREWIAYAELEPFGEARADVRQGLTSLMVAAGMGIKKRRGGDFKLEDFMTGTDHREPDPEDSKVVMACMKFNARVAAAMSGEESRK